MADGIALYSIPQTSIAKALIRAETAAKRREILGRRRKAISADCRKAVEGLRSEAVATYAPFALAALDALDNSHTEAAQALTGSLIDSLLTAYFGKDRYKYTPAKMASGPPRPTRVHDWPVGWPWPLSRCLSSSGWRTATACRPPSAATRQPARGGAATESARHGSTLLPRPASYSSIERRIDGKPPDRPPPGRSTRVHRPAPVHATHSPRIACRPNQTLRADGLARCSRRPGRRFLWVTQPPAPSWLKNGDQAADRGQCRPNPTPRRSISACNRCCGRSSRGCQSRHGGDDAVNGETRTISARDPEAVGSKK